jgi:Kef-type K+ transport system membrane component KefB
MVESGGFIMESGLIKDVALCIIAAWVVGVAAQALRQPLLLAYLIAGFAVGPNGFRLVTDAHTIETIASIGLILLLFMIGLEIDLKKMTSAGRLITLTAAVQIFGCLALGWLFFRYTGLAGGWLEALYLGVAVALSSTVIIVKLLHDKHELETLAGRITLGILVLQDLFAILFLALQPNLKQPEPALIALALGKVVLLVASGLLISRFALPPLFQSIARVPELVLVGALAWCFAMAGLAHQLGLSREMGALVAGVAISTYPYTLDVTAKVTSLRDFFVTLFFVGLGMTIPLPTWALVLQALIFSAFLVGSRLLTVFPPLYWMGQGHRVSLLPAISLCQLSELSLVLLALGKAAGDVSVESISAAAFAFAFLAVDSTYAIMANDFLLRKVSPWLTRAGLKDLSTLSADLHEGKKPPRIFLLGFCRTASSLLEAIERDTPALLPELAIVDFNPEVGRRLKARGVRAIYGDVSQKEVLAHAGVSQAEILISTLPNSLLKGTDNLKLLRILRELAPEATVIAHAESLPEAQALYGAGAGYVITPRLLEADRVMEALAAIENGLLSEEQARHREELEGRKEVVA